MENLSNTTFNNHFFYHKPPLKKERARSTLYCSFLFEKPPVVGIWSLDQLFRHWSSCAMHVRLLNPLLSPFPHIPTHFSLLIPFHFFLSFSSINSGHPTPTRPLLCCRNKLTTVAHPPPPSSLCYQRGYCLNVVVPILSPVAPSADHFATKIILS